MHFLEKYQDRIDEMQLGIRELDSWLVDCVSQGTATLHAQDYNYFDNIAARLVDLKLPGIARRIRAMERNRILENWSEMLSKEIAELHLFAQQFQKIQQLDPNQQMALIQDAGINLKKKEIIEHIDPVEDYWIVLGIAQGVDDRIRFRRTWVWGQAYQAAALLLDFAWGNTDFETNYTQGAAFQAKLHFYPGPNPIRAQASDVLPKDKPFARLDGIVSIQQFILQYTQALANQPGLRSFPGLLAEIVPFEKEGQFFICDQEKYYLPLGNEAPWKLIAMSGGHPIMLFGTWNGIQFQALCGIINKRIVPV